MHIKGWKAGLETEVALSMREVYSLPVIAKSSVGSVLATYCESAFSVDMTVVEAGSQRLLIDIALSSPKSVRLARMSRHPRRVFRKLDGAMIKEKEEKLN